jgi:cytochrome b pre-mRNA-processing protein 3
MDPAQQQRMNPGRLRALWRRWRAVAPARALRRRRADQLYLQLVGQARNPVFYGALGVPDTPEGRFEMVALHAALLLRRLKLEGVQGQELGQELFDLMFADLDVNLREMGVGDLSVGRYVKRLAQNFFARVAALDGALVAPDLDAVRTMLRSNAYHGGPRPAPAQVDTLTDYLIELDRVLASQSAAVLMSGRIEFPQPAVVGLPERPGDGLRASV